jgi:hypothetical protein
VISLMRLLTEAHHDSGGQRVFTDRELMERVREYGDGADPVRTLNNDKAALRARGLIVTRQRHPDEARARGTRRAPYLEKAAHLWLTAEEHQVLREVREARITHSESAGKPLSGFPVGPTSSPMDGDERANTTVDDALRLLRLLEERGGEVSVEVVADCFGIGERRARNWLVQIADGFDDSDLIEVLYADDDLDDVENDDRDPVVRAVALRANEPLD